MPKHHPWGALLLVALPLFCQTPSNKKTHELLRFTLNESPEQIIALLGRPEHVQDSFAGYQSWRYDWPPGEENDDNSPPAWIVCIRTDNRQVLSVMRNFDRPMAVDDLFPAAETAVYKWPSKEAPQFSLQLRRLSGESLLLAMGTAKPGDRTSQLVLIRRSALRTFMPWLAEQLQ